MTNYIDKGATISRDGKYRYRLWREWRGTHDPKNWTWYSKKHGQPRACVFIMLNPSTADGNEDDPTIRRCVAFARRWNYERLEVVNLFAYRATDPRELLALGDLNEPVGPDNIDHVRRAVEDRGLIVAAWGAHGGHLDQARTVAGWIGDRSMKALGLTKDGHPRHPLYVRADAPLIEYRP